MLWGDLSAEVSDTAKVWTDEQERDKRHNCSGKQAHHCKAQRIQKNSYVDSAGLDLKDIYLTKGGLIVHELAKVRSQRSTKLTPKSEAIVAGWNEPSKKDGRLIEPVKGWTACPASGGIRLSLIRYGGSNFEFASLILNKDKGIIGVKSDGTDTRRTAVYETRTACPDYSIGIRWCERRTPSVFTGGAVYSIVTSWFLFK